MMEEKKSLYYYISHLFTTYGIMVLIFVVLTDILGVTAQGYSTMFEMGKKGLSLNTLLQLFALAVIISVCRRILYSDGLIKSMSMIARTIIFFVAITVTIMLFVIFFGWFPINDISAWIGFFISFAICSAVAVIFSRIREHAENDRMNRALEKYKSIKGDSDDNGK